MMIAPLTINLQLKLTQLESSLFIIEINLSFKESL